MNSKQKLKTALIQHSHEVGMSTELGVMIKRAEEGYYSDYDSELATPCVQLVEDLESIGATNLATLAREGEFDATKEESDDWYEREGRQIAKEQFGENLSKILFGE